MTRETKIGLLVGLAFIIIVGILLSEPLNHAGDATPAPLPGVGANTRQAIAVPGGNAVAPPISIQNPPAQPAGPAQPIPTVNEVTQPRGGITITVGGANTGGSNSSPRAGNTQVGQAHPTDVHVDGGNGRTENPGRVTLSNSSQTPVNTGGVTIEPPTATGNPANDPQRVEQPAQPNPPRGNDPLGELARQHPDELINLDTHNNRGGNEAGPTRNGQPAGKPTKAAHEYQAVAGDSLSKIAAKAYGTATKANMDAIVAANPSLKADRNKIIAGQSYAIPAFADAAAAPALTTSTPASPLKASAPAPTPPPPAKTTEYTYTVKAGDTLWAIARDKVGDPTAIAALKELNKDTLKGADTVRVGMKLKLPAKPVN